MEVIKKENWLLFLFSVTMISLVIEARIVMSQAIIWLLLTSVVSILPGQFPFFQISEVFRRHIGRFWHYRAYSVVLLIFMSVLLSGLWSPANGDWLSKVTMRLPFLAMPLAFAWLPAVSKRNYRIVFYGMLLLLSVVSAGVLLNYVFHFETITETLRHGKNIPVPMNHIRFSLLLGLGICSGILLWLEEFYIRFAWERRIILGICIFLFITIHILSVRSGIVALYATLALLGFRYYIVKKKEYLKGIALGASLMVIPILAYLVLPSLQNKVMYSMYDMEQFRAGKGSDFSDSERFGSIMVGIDIGNRYPLMGCGYGNLDSEIKSTYQRVFPQDNECKLPHNQFVMTYAAAGLLGVFILLIAFFYPLFYRKNYRDWYFLALHCIVFCSFLVEATIETQVGTLLYTFFLGLGLNFNMAERD